MNIEQIRHYCLSKPNVTESCPFGDDTLVFKVFGKMFALTALDSAPSINLKCDPELSYELQDRYQAVKPGYHMNKKHWITVEIDGTIPSILLTQWIDNSYKLVFDKLPKKNKKLN